MEMNNKMERKSGQPFSRGFCSSYWNWSLLTCEIPIGSTANIAVTGIIERQKIGHVTFGPWIKPGAIVSIPTLAIATILIYVQFY